MPKIKPIIRPGEKTIREIFEQLLTKGMSIRSQHANNHQTENEQQSGMNPRLRTYKTTRNRHAQSGLPNRIRIEPIHGTNPALLHFLIALAGYSARKIATDNGVSGGMLSQIINGRGARSERVEIYISHITKVKLSQLFPKWYSEL